MSPAPHLVDRAGQRVATVVLQAWPLVFHPVLPATLTCAGAQFLVASIPSFHQDLEGVHDPPARNGRRATSFCASRGPLSGDLEAISGWVLPGGTSRAHIAVRSAVCGVETPVGSPTPPWPEGGASPSRQEAGRPGPGMGMRAAAEGWTWVDRRAASVICVKLSGRVHLKCLQGSPLWGESWESGPSFSEPAPFSSSGDQPGLTHHGHYPKGFLRKGRAVVVRTGACREALVWFQSHVDCQLGSNPRVKPRFCHL